MQISRNTVVAVLVFVVLVIVAVWIKWQLYFNMTQEMGEGMRERVEAEESAVVEESASE